MILGKTYLGVRTIAPEGDCSPVGVVLGLGLGFGAIILELSNHYVSHFILKYTTNTCEVLG